MLPIRNQSEPSDEFIVRCMSDPGSKEIKDPDERYAACSRQSRKEDVKAQYWKTFDRQRQAFNTFAENRINAAFDEQFKRLEEAIALATTPEAIEDGFTVDPEIFKQALIDIYQTVGVNFAREQYVSLKTHHNTMEHKQDEIPEMSWGEALQAYIEELGGEKVVGISRETLRIVKRSIGLSIAEGDGVDKAARRLRADWTTLNRSRAKRIARTEIIGASNRGAVEGAAATGLNLVKEWITTRDSSARDAHIDADGQQVGLHEEFDVNGEFLSQPGDPKGSPDNVINCRCSVGFVRP